MVAAICAKFRMKFTFLNEQEHKNSILIETRFLLLYCHLIIYNFQLWPGGGEGRGEVSLPKELKEE